MRKTPLRAPKAADAALRRLVASASVELSSPETLRRWDVLRSHARRVPASIRISLKKEATARFESLDFGLPVLNQYI